jgi:hypothetical protein
MDQIREWAKRYTELLSFSKVAREFGVNVKTVNSQLTKHKEELGLVLVHEEYSSNMQSGLKTCNDCGDTKGIDGFERYSGGLRSVCRVCRAAKNKDYRDSHKESIQKYSKEYRTANAEEISKKRKQTYPLVKDAYLKKQSEYYYTNKTSIRERRRMIHSKRMNTDLEYKIKHTVRARFNSMIKNRGMVKNASVIDIVGCTMPDLISHLESLFKPGMSWDNYGLHGWHIDHVAPLASFDVSKEEELRKAWHYTNLQPLWAKDNLSKGTKIINGDTNGTI